MRGSGGGWSAGYGMGLGRMTSAAAGQLGKGDLNARLQGGEAALVEDVEAAAVEQKQHAHSLVTQPCSKVERCVALLLRRGVHRCAASDAR